MERLSQSLWPFSYCRLLKGTRIADPHRPNKNERAHLKRPQRDAAAADAIFFACKSSSMSPIIGPLCLRSMWHTSQVFWAKHSAAACILKPCILDAVSCRLVGAAGGLFAVLIGTLVVFAACGALARQTWRPLDKAAGQER